MNHPIPVYVTRRRGFSLVLSLTVMAMLLLLCISIAAMMSIELRVARTAVSQARARMNAMVGARIALGELQRLAGPDQRVTAMATLFTNQDESATDPAVSTYDNGPLGPVIHPRWVGVWHSGKTEDKSVAGVRGSGDENLKVVQRTGDGFLRDSRFANGRDWATDRFAINPTASTKRFLGWLVSGNEGLAGTAAQTLTPFTPVRASRAADTLDRAEDVTLLGSGVFGGALPTPDNTAGADRLGARAAKIVITDVDRRPIGAYAYWVGDEGVKARFNISDKFAAAGLEPKPSRAGDGGYARLQVSQRNRFDTVVSPIVALGQARLPAVVTANEAVLDSLMGFEDLGRLDRSADTDALRRAYYHEIGFTSAGVAADVVNGGLKKDLSAFFRLNPSEDIPSHAGDVSSGLRGVDPLVSESTLAPISPRLDLFRQWWQAGATMSGSAIPAVAATGFPQTFNIVANPHNNQSVAHPALTVRLPDFSMQTRGAIAPVLFDFSVNVQPAIDASNPNQGYARMKTWIRTALWNPYSVPLKLDGYKLHYLNNIYIYHAYSTIGNLPYVYNRPRITMELPSVTLQPGQSMMFVVDPGSVPMPTGDATYATAYGPLTVRLKAAGPQASDHFYDYICSAYSGARVNLTANGTVWPTQIGTPSPGQSPSGNIAITVRFGLSVPLSMSYFINGFDQSVANLQQVIVADASGQAVQQVNMNPYDDLTKAGLPYVGEPNTAATQYRPVGTFIYSAASIDTVLGRGTPPGMTPDQHYGFRMKFIDGTDTTDTGVAGVAPVPNPYRDLEIAPLADVNPRSPRPSRDPFDGLDMLSPRQMYLAGLWTVSPKDAFAVPAWTPAPSSPTRVMPFISAQFSTASTYPGALLYDVAWKDAGILSLGALRHAATNILPYGPAMPLGNSRIPLPLGNDAIGLMKDASGLTSGDLNDAWAQLPWARRDEQLRQFQNPGGTGIGAGTHDIFDIAYEQNYALWDAYHVSGIGRENTGWASDAWENRTPGASTIEHLLPLSRQQPLSGLPDRAGYFASENYALYKAPFSLITRGAFNVNSTSVVAWKSLLQSFRGISVPTREAGDAGGAQLTPFPRVLRPKSGLAKDSSASAASFEENSWSGLRALTDDECEKLARKIVVEVKKRGPFLGLSDFINRRLKAPTSGDLADWETKERDFLGTLDAAIDAAGLNNQFGVNGDPTRVKRDKDLANPEFASGTAYLPKQLKFKAKHRVSGVPGYLEQSDLLSPLAPVLTARSDTFTIRARGMSDDGAEAAVELVVQRLPEPAIGGAPSARPVVPVNPAVSRTDNAFLGRRFSILSQRWIKPEEI